MRETLTPRAGDTEEPRFTLCPKDVSALITIPAGQFNQRFDKPVNHPGGARVVIGQQGKRLKVQSGKGHLTRSMDMRITDTKVIEDNRQLASCWPLGLYRTSRPVRMSGKFSKSGLSGNRTFSFPDAGLLTLLKVEERKKKLSKIFSIFFFFKIFFCLFSNTPQFRFFDTKFVSMSISYDNW
jgi:hypothetical protein